MTTAISVTSRNEHGIPKYCQIRQFIVEEEIEKKRLKAGDGIPSENELSRKFNVSKNTVVKALNDLVKDGVLYRVQGKGTFVSQISKKATTNIGVLVYHVDNPFYSGIVKSIDERAHSKGFHTLLGNTLGDKQIERTYIREFAGGNKIDGLILCPVTPPTDDFIMTLKQMGMPFVFLYPQTLVEDVNCINADDEKGAYEATMHLVRLGHRRIAFLGSNNLGNINVAGKENGYAKALKDAAIPFDIDIVFRLRLDEIKIQDYDAIIEKFSNMTDPPTATFAIGDVPAIDFLMAVKKKGLRVPEDMAIIGYDDIEMAARPDIQLTTVAQPIKSTGELAADMIIEALKGKSATKQLVLPQRLVIRNTCGWNCQAKIRNSSK